MCQSKARKDMECRYRLCYSVSLGDIAAGRGYTAVYFTVISSEDDRLPVGTTAILFGGQVVHRALPFMAEKVPFAHG